MSLYRKYRPRSFDEVVGQQAVVRTLRNAIARDRVAHAYLLSGPRGSGKTSLARLLACALNAAEGPTADFDVQSPACQAILAGNSLAITEMDAASQGGIDDVRELRRAAALAPPEGQVKVFILDEAHSLTTAASNALLKLLEEPPANVVFVLCTTDPEALLETISSRCQQLELQRPTIGEIVQALRRICSAEQIAHDEDALRVVARAGQGSFRDAITALEKAVVGVDGPLTEAEVADVLGIVSDEVAMRLMSGIAAGQPTELLRGVEQLARQGLNLTKALDALIAWTRLLYLQQYLHGLPEDEPLSEAHHQQLVAQAQQLGLRDTLLCADWLSAGAREIKAGSEPRVALEIALLRCANREQQLDARVSALERAVGSA